MTREQAGLQVRARPLDLQLARPFVISRGARRRSENVLVEVVGAESSGLGEGAPNARFGETQQRCLAWLLEIGWLPRFASLDGLEAVLSTIRPGAPRAALAALDIALHDWLARDRGVSVGRLLGVDRLVGPVTSFTMGIASPSQVERLIAEADEIFSALVADPQAHWPLLKLKLGADVTAARAMVSAARRSPRPRRLIVDANEAWPDPGKALIMLQWLAEQGVEAVEQPMPALTRPEDLRWLHERSPLPLIADEACAVVEDIKRAAGAYDVVNVKLDKCGGLREARALVAAGRSLGLKLMVGCMVASSLALTAAAHIAMQADYADLDGHLLLASDPFAGQGLRFDGSARVVLPGSATRGLCISLP